MDLPIFTYHPDPIASGCIKHSNETCLACNQARGYIYTGPVFALQDLHDKLCPWCIQDGAAHEKFDAEFVDQASIGGYDKSDAVPQAVIEEVAFRTPCFTGWQQERWFTHCGDAGIFLAVAGYKELKQFGSEALTAIAGECGYQGAELDEYLHALKKEDQPTAYLFQCRHCGKYGGYSDYT